MLCLNDQTFSSLTGKTSGLPNVELERRKVSADAITAAVVGLTWSVVCQMNDPIGISVLQRLEEIPIHRTFPGVNLGKPFRYHHFAGIETCGQSCPPAQALDAAGYGFDVVSNGAISYGVQTF